MLVPQALEGVAAVALLYAAVQALVRRGPPAWRPARCSRCTPVAALMFRFNNPDALLVLMLVASAYCLTRALERAGTRWILAAGAVIGIAFLAKMMQAFLVAARVRARLPRRRADRRCAGASASCWPVALAVVVSAGWWVAIVALWPAALAAVHRRLAGQQHPQPDRRLQRPRPDLRQLWARQAGQRAVAAVRLQRRDRAAAPVQRPDGRPGLVAAAGGALALVAGLWARRRAPRTDRTRAALLLWGGWLVVTAAVFSFSSGVIHTYYTVALAPAIGALVAIGGAWRGRTAATRAARALAALAVAGTAVWAYAAARPHAVVVALAAGAGAHQRRAGRCRNPGSPRRSPAGGAAAASPWPSLAAVAVLAGPLAYAADTVTTPHTGSIPSAGPAAAGAVRRRLRGGGARRLPRRGARAPAVVAGGPPSGSGFRRRSAAGRRRGAPPSARSGSLPPRRAVRLRARPGGSPARPAVGPRRRIGRPGRRRRGA